MALHPLPDSSAGPDAPLDAQIARIAGALSAGGPEAFARAVAEMKGAPLAADLPVEQAARAMRRVAALDLSLGRLLEGHVNARLLIRLHAEGPVRRQALRDMEDGQLFGVWGADGAEPVALQGDRLTGRKRYASGLGLVDRAIVSARSPEGQRLVLVEAGDPARHAPEEWDMAGMQASRSGGFDCAGLPVQPLGPPDVYTREPHFAGGTWRIAAVTLGGIAGLLEATAARLRDRGHDQAEAHLLRLSPLAGRAVAAWPAILRAGRVASGPEGAADPERAAVLSAGTRLLTEELGQDTIAAVERSIGLGLFETGDEIGRRARDLACYMRQAARDAFALRVGRALLSAETPLGGWLDD